MEDRGARGEARGNSRSNAALARTRRRDIKGSCSPSSPSRGVHKVATRFERFHKVWQYDGQPPTRGFEGKGFAAEGYWVGGSSSPCTVGYRQPISHTTPTTTTSPRRPPTLHCTLHLVAVSFRFVFHAPEARIAPTSTSLPPRFILFRVLSLRSPTADVILRPLVTPHQDTDFMHSYWILVHCRVFRTLRLCLTH